MEGIVNFAPLPAPVDSVPAAGKVIAGEPRQQVWNVLSSGDGRFHTGEWASSKGSWRVSYTEHEFCHILEGAVRITDAQGESRVYRAGESFVVRSGFEGTWEVLDYCRKLYAIYE